MAEPTDDELAAARDEGRSAAHKSATSAPAEQLLKLAWAQGFGQVDQLTDMIRQARAEGVTWRQIARALGENQRTVETKYGGGRERMRAYRQRKRDRG